MVPSNVDTGFNVMLIVEDHGNVATYHPSVCWLNVSVVAAPHFTDILPAVQFVIFTATLNLSDDV